MGLDTVYVRGQEDMLHAVFTADEQERIYTEAKQRLAQRTNARSVMAGKAKDNRHITSGIAGEHLIAKLFPDFQFADVPDYDFIAGPKQQKFDVKARSMNGAPHVHFDVRIPEYQFKRQKCDSYIFTSAIWDDRNSRLVEGWVLGWLPKSTFGATATLRTQGYKHFSSYAEESRTLVTTIDKLYAPSALRRAVGLGS